MGWYRRFVNVLRSDRLSADIDREMAFHMAERADDLVAEGMSEAEARREARRRFGNPGVQKERARDADLLTWLESLGADVRYAFRAMRASPGFTLVTILSLALGIGANTAIFSLINAVVLRTLPVSHPEELVQMTYVTSGGAAFTNPLWEEIRDRQDVFSGVFAYGNQEFNLSAGGEVRRAAGNTVSGDYFSTLGVQAAAGRLISRSDDYRGCPGAAVLSHGFWQREYGGSPSAIGKTIMLSGHPFPIVGVADPAFFGVDVGRSVQVYVPLCTLPVLQSNPAALDLRSRWFLWIIGRPKPDVTQAALSARLAALAPAVFAATVPPNWDADGKTEYVKRSLGVTPAANGLSQLRREYRRALVVLMAVVATVLLIACANVANLLLARAATRGREMAIRLAIGAARRRLVRQLLTESVLLAGIGAGLGILFARWGSQLLVGTLSSGGGDVSLDLSLDGRVLAFTLTVAVATGILFGLAPAWRSTRVDPQAALKANGRGVAEGHSRFSLGKALVVAQIALSLVLVVGAGLFVGSFRKLTTVDPGFRRDGVLLVSTSLRNAGYSDSAFGGVQWDLLARLRALPGVQAASMSRMTPISGSSWNNEISADGFTPATRQDALVYFNEVSDGYFSTMGTPLLAGRDFADRDGPGSPKVALINEAMARRVYGTSNPLGKRFHIVEPNGRGAPIEVIGVVKDAKYVELREETIPTVFLATSQAESPDAFATYELRAAGPPAALAPAVKALVAEVNRSITLEMRTLSSQVDASLSRDRLLATLSGFFGALALLLATVGLYGTLSYAVARRRNEIGIRIALGAARARVMRLVLGEVARMVVAGILLGGVVALATTRWVESFLYGLTASDPKTLTAATVMLALVAVAAGVMPAWRAARVDPISALRDE
jgi:predicted permease